MEKLEVNGTTMCHYTYKGRSFVVGIGEVGNVSCHIHLRLSDITDPEDVIWFKGKPYLEYNAGDVTISEATEKCKWIIDQLLKAPRKRKNRSRYKKHLNTIRVALEELTEYSEELTPEQLRMGASELREELEKLDAEHRKSIAALRKK